ncbi:MAG: ribokinase [Rariglobus sp.]|jgi:ribokinase|nr:ribokinase [Rariglobus sp.]
MKPQVVVVGSFVQDLTWNCLAFPAAGETVIGTFASGPGGKGSNQAVAAGRAGAATLFIGAVGRDTFAAGARAFYKAEKIAARFVEKPGHATGTAAILVNTSGQNEIVVALGANARLSPADLDPKFFANAKVVVTQLESGLAAAAFALKTARAAGAVAVLNPAPMRADFKPSLLGHADILIPNEAEFTALVNLLPATGRTDFTEAALATLSDEAIHALARTFGPPVVIVTLGKRGCLVSQKSGYTFISSHRVKAIDTTGAGDAFVGGFSAGLVRFKGDLVAAARFGTAVAALSVTRRGTAPAMPRKREIEAFLKKTR